MEWIIPDLDQELGEFERVAKHFGLNLQTLIFLFSQGTVEDLDEETWGNLENTDSWETLRLEDVFRNAANTKRDAPALLKAFRCGKPMQMPIILILADGKSHLVSGNTRLMLCRATRERPKVFKLRIE